MKIELVRKLRKNQTESENILWQCIRNRKLYGKKFLRQHPVEIEYGRNTKLFILDFYCRENHLGIEIDGKIHDKQKEFDLLREELISKKNIKIIRFTNEDVKNNIEAVLKKIMTHLELLSVKQMEEKLHIQKMSAPSPSNSSPPSLNFREGARG